MNKTRYKVQHCDTRGVWVPMHRGTLKTYSAAMAKRQAFCRIMVDYFGTGAWEVIDLQPPLAMSWDVEKLAMLANDRCEQAPTAKEKQR